MTTRHMKTEKAAMRTARRQNVPAKENPCCVGVLWQLDGLSITPFPEVHAKFQEAPHHPERPAYIVHILSCACTVRLVEAATGFPAFFSGLVIKRRMRGIKVQYSKCYHTA